MENPQQRATQAFLAWTIKRHCQEPAKTKVEFEKLIEGKFVVDDQHKIDICKLSDAEANAFADLFAT